MLAVQSCPVPLHSLLDRYRIRPGFTDCYGVDVEGAVTLQVFVAAFYTTPLFTLERTLLHYLAALPSSDADAHALACGTTGTFSAWTVEARTPSELLLADITGRTRSWLMVETCSESNQPVKTRLYFGSAVLPRSGRGGSKPDMGCLFHLLSGIHQRYARMLLSAARRRVSPIP